MDKNFIVRSNMSNEKKTRFIYQNLLRAIYKFTIMERKYSEYVKMTPRGLKNVGNSCFINSREQCIRAVEFWYNRRFPRKNDPLFRDFQQHDVHEYHLNEVNFIEEILQKQNKNEVFESYFKGVFTTKSKFPCGHTNIRKENFFVLSVPVGSTMEEMISSLEKEDEYMLTCDTCQNGIKIRAKSHMSVSHVPHIVTFHIKRFNMYGNKLNDDIDVPLSWTYIRNNQNKKFSCIGFIVHIGNHITSGHYIAFCNYNSHWYMCDDMVVKTVLQKNNK